MQSSQTDYYHTDPNLECQHYDYPPVTQVENQFPEIWTIANILSNDNVAQARFNSMQNQIPNILPKGTQPQSTTGDFSNFAYPDGDPDCWWTYKLCATPKLPGIPNDIIIVPEVSIPMIGRKFGLRYLLNKTAGCFRICF